MGLKDVAGVFSKYFVVGFFLPAFFALVALSVFLSHDALPKDYRGYSTSTQILVLGGLGLLFGQLLSGLNKPIIRLFEGYALETGRTKPNSRLDRVRRWKSRRWLRQFDELSSIKAQDERTPARTEAAIKLSLYFPRTRGEVMPTRFGNVVRSFERHPRARWGLDGVTVWPRIEMLLTQQQLDLISDARTDVMFLLNSTVNSAVVGLLLTGDGLINWVLPVYAAPLYALPFGLAFWFYRAATKAAEGWGDEVRSAFDLGRLDLYRRLGVRLPRTHAEEVLFARCVNRCLLYGEPIPGSIRKTEEEAPA
jgi:hypothetical protein